MILQNTFTSSIFTLSLIICFTCCESKKESQSTKEEVVEMSSIKTIGDIIRLDPVLDQIISPKANIEVLADGFTWSEGPLWIEDGQFIIFSDVPQNTIFKWKEGEGISTYLTPSGYTGEGKYSNEPGSNGLTLDSEGRLVLCQHGDRKMARMNASTSEPKPEFVTLSDNYSGKKFNSPNDCVYDSKGNLYFTDPPYGLPQQMNDPTKEIPFQGIYKYSPESGTTLLSDELSRPNGIAFSPNESILYVANSDPDRPIIMAYEATEEGYANKGKVFFDGTSLLKAGGKGLPDGLKVNAEGVLFATGPGGVLIISPEGQHLGTISSGEATSNCAFGNQGKYIYATSDMYLIRVPLL